MQIRFVFEKATKNTYRFQEDLQDREEALVGTIYVKKHVFASQPQAIIVQLIEE